MIAKKTAALCAALALTAVLGVFPGHAAVLAASEKDDFYQAVNEKTLAEKQIKPTEASWSWFHERNLENKEFLTGEIEDIASHQGTYDKGTPEQKIADLYHRPENAQCHGPEAYPGRTGSHQSGQDSTGTDGGSGRAPSDIWHRCAHEHERTASSRQPALCGTL